MPLKNRTNILIVEHSPSDIELIQYELKKGGISFACEIVQDEEAYQQAIQDFMPDLILCDYSLPSFSGVDAFAIRQQMAADTPFIFVSGNIGEENSVEHIKNGVTDYVLKDKLFSLSVKVLRALKEATEKEQKNRTAQELVHSEKTLARAQAIAQIGSWEIDMTHNLHYWSDEVYKIFGIEKSSVDPSEAAFMKFFHPDDLANSYRLINEGFKSSRNISFDFRFIRQDGTLRYGYNEWRFKFGKGGKPERLFGIIQDITQRKQAEIERLKMVSDLLVRNKELEQFTYIVSHNLRAPVANILGAVNIMNDPELATEKKASVGQGLVAAVTRLDNVVQDLNQILQVKNTNAETKELVSFSGLVDDIRISIKNLFDQDNMCVECDFSAVDQFLTFKSYLHSIFFNLISNSIKYCQPQVPCMIEIKSALKEKKIELTFTDNGMGINLKKRGDQVFGLYKRFHSGIEGKGMGLYMVKTQVETLGGKISIESEVNKGTEFKIEFEI